MLYPHPPKTHFHHFADCHMKIMVHPSKDNLTPSPSEQLNADHHAVNSTVWPNPTCSLSHCILTSFQNLVKLEDQRHRWLTTYHGLFMGYCGSPIRHICHRPGTFQSIYSLQSRTWHDILTSKSTLIRLSKSNLSFSARCRSYHGFRSSCMESKILPPSHPFSGPIICQHY